MTASRRRDAARTRERIVTAARRHFALTGYDHATVREIAQDADVSPNLITRYFGGKWGLFVAATDVDLHIADVLPGPRSGLARRIATQVVTRWEGRPGDDPVLMMMRAAMNDRDAAEHFSEFFRRQAAVPLIEHLGVPDGSERAAAVGAAIMGVVVQRYALQTGPTVAASPEQVVEWLAHLLGRVLSGAPFPSLGDEPAGTTSGGASAGEVREA